MNRPSRILGIVCLASLLATQASGLHLHVDEAGRNAGLHSAHVHQVHRDDHQDDDYLESSSHQGDLHAHQSDDHDHSQESDVSLFEQLTSSPYSDQGTAALGQAYSPQTQACSHDHAGIPPDSGQYDPSCIHWRPPLRAPPHLL